MVCRSPGAILQIEQLDACMHMRFPCCAAVHVDRTLHVDLHVFIRDMQVFEEVDFRMPGLVGGTTVPPLLFGSSRRVYMYLSEA